MFLGKKIETGELRQRGAVLYIEVATVPFACRSFVWEVSYASKCRERADIFSRIHACESCEMCESFGLFFHIGYFGNGKSGSGYESFKLDRGMRSRDLG